MRRKVISMLKVGAIRKLDGLPPDTATAEQALSDMDRIAAGKKDIPVWGITIPDLEYYAGTIAWRDLRSDSRAYSYWKLCADNAHAGCVFDLADAYIVGWGGMKPDLATALDLYLKVFETGTNYTCAGAHAAAFIAELSYFTGISPPPIDNDPVSWMQKSYALSDVIEARPSSKGRCSGSEARIEEFLYRLARGDRRGEILTQATQHLGDDSTALTALINYLSGSLDEKGFEATVESSKSDASRCSAYFHAMWYSDLIGATEFVNKFYQPLLKFDHLTCPSFLVFAKKFHLEGAQIHLPVPQP